MLAFFLLLQGLAHQRHCVLEGHTPLLVDLEDGGAVLRLLNRPSSFLLVSLMVYCPSHVRECSAQYVVVVVKGRVCCKAEVLQQVRYHKNR
jgi:hypothetical protein